MDYIDTWKAMEKLVDTGLVRSIGISNFNSEQVDRLLANCRIRPVNNQVAINKSLFTFAYNQLLSNSLTFNKLEDTITD